MKFIPILFILTSLAFAAKPLGTGWETVLDSCSGDLDKDGISEKVQVVEYPMGKDSMIAVELQIFKKKSNGRDSLWFVSKRPFDSPFLYDEGGIYRFRGIGIRRGSICISNRWDGGPDKIEIDVTSQYRFQNNTFHLIGVTHRVAWWCGGENDKPYTKEITTDINLSTGKGILTKTYEICDEEKVDKIPNPKSIPFTLDQCSATKTANGKEQKLTTADLKNITIANHKYGEISLTIKGESISF